MSPHDADPPATGRKPLFSLLASLLISGGAFLAAGDTRRFLRWMLPLTGSGLLLLWCWDTPGTLPLWGLYLLAAAWLAAWGTMLGLSVRTRFEWRLERLAVIALLGGALSYFTFLQLWSWLGFYHVDTYSMEPTLLGPIKDEDGEVVRPMDNIVADYVTYRHRRPIRGEIAMFWPKDMPVKLPPDVVNPIAKRIVGLPGETVRIDPPHIYINGQPLENPPIFRKMTESRDGYRPADFNPLASELFNPPVLGGPEDEITLGPDEFFVLHDNPLSSYPDRPKLDSRHFGPLPGSIFYGRVLYIVAPHERRGWVE